MCGYPAARENDVRLKRLWMRDRNQGLGRLEDSSCEIVQTVDRSAEPLASEPAGGRPDRALDGRNAG
jgi:hypothetical protein